MSSPFTIYSIKFHQSGTEHLWMSTYQCPGRIFVDADKAHVAVVVKESKHKELNANILKYKVSMYIDTHGWIAYERIFLS